MSRRPIRCAPIETSRALRIEVDHDSTGFPFIHWSWLGPIPFGNLKLREAKALRVMLDKVIAAAEAQLEQEASL